LEAAQGNVELGPAAGRAPVIRVIAPDQLDMGFSERLEHTSLPSAAGSSSSYRTLEQRIYDLDAVVTELISPSNQVPVFGLGHDWGGIISLGWATDADVRASGSGVEPSGMISLNTAVWAGESAPIPAPADARPAGPRFT